MESKELRFKYKRKGKTYAMPKGTGPGKSCRNDPEWEEVSPGRYRKKNRGQGRRESRVVNHKDFIASQVLKHENLLSDIRAGNGELR